jgi:general secretion pathway protein D
MPWSLRWLPAQRSLHHLGIRLRSLFRTTVIARSVHVTFLFSLRRMSYHPRSHFPVFAVATVLAAAAASLTAQTASPGPADVPSPANPPEPAVITAPASLPASTALPGPQPSPEEIIGPIQMRGETLEAVLFQLGKWTGRSIIRPQALPLAADGYTITLPPMPKSEVILAIETMLELGGIAVSPLGDHFLKIVPLGQVRTEAPEMIEGSTLDLPPSGRIVTKLFRLSFLRVTELKDQVVPLLNPNLGGPVLFEKTNAALLTDSLSTLQRIEQLIRELDKPALPSLQPKFYSLQNGAKASDLVNKISAILKPPLNSQISSATSISADDRTNQIVLISDARQYPFFDELIAKLDVKADPNTRNQVINLKHATAKDVATLLTNLVSGRNQNAKGTDQGGRPGQLPSNQRMPTGNPAQPNVPVAAQPALVNLSGDSGSNSEFSSLITILADERSNSVVVSGTVDDIRLIREIVDKVDVLLAQVSIQVVIAEVTLSDTDASGINALNLTFGTDAVRGTHITNFEANGGSSSPGGIAGWNITSGVVSPLSFQAILGNTGAKSNVKVLSANTIVTTHNKPAEFVVSQQLPIITGTTTSPGTTGTFNGYNSSTVTYKDIGIDVKVTPLIGDDGSVQLEIDQKVDDKVGEVQVDANTQPIIGHRQATSFINVGDGQMIVLGGLQQTKRSTSRSKLGFLYEIPILSHLLGGRTHIEERTELLLFVRPHIIPPGRSTFDANATIDQLKSKDSVKQFLEDPSKDRKEGYLKQITQ